MDTKQTDAGTGYLHQDGVNLLMADRDRLSAENKVLREALEEVTRCLAWHVDSGRGVAMDGKAVTDARAFLSSLDGGKHV